MFMVRRRSLADKICFSNSFRREIGSIHDPKEDRTIKKSAPEINFSYFGISQEGGRNILNLFLLASS
jgi:hypothetical protein